ncbi:Hypothetical predicted protein [Cloeon dipterum]|uniref:Uncharacterized protein n=1 Tax=Cloeon dipterum TaxID=197152 RepID=A0A8S1EC99_9INSE|nr:Hypothetical predicted protein [Cloeon dipterum]
MSKSDLGTCCLDGGQGAGDRDRPRTEVASPEFTIHKVALYHYRSTKQLCCEMILCKMRRRAFLLSKMLCAKKAVSSRRQQ